MHHIGSNSNRAIPGTPSVTAPRESQGIVKLAPKPRPTNQTVASPLSASFIRNCLGSIELDKVIKFLGNKKPGDYLIRESTTSPGTYTLSFLKKNGEVSNIRNIRSFENAEFAIKKESLTPRLISPEEYKASLAQEEPSLELNPKEKEAPLTTVQTIHSSGFLDKGSMDFMFFSFLTGSFAGMGKRVEPLLPDNQAVVDSLNTKTKMADRSPNARCLINLVKAIRDKDPTLSILSTVDLFAENKEDRPLKFSFTECAAQGIRDEMEDEHFILNLPNNEKLIGVFDGHDGDVMAKFAKQYFKEHFSYELSKNPDDLEKVFQTLLDKINAEAKARGLPSGSTVCVTYINNENMAYTLTLGDSETKVFRKIGGKWKVIPLSLVMNWCKRKEEKRASDLSREVWERQNNYDAKKRLSPLSTWGSNVPRALGDFRFDHSGIINKGKVTRFQLEKNDVLISACDGLWDYVSDDSISQMLDYNSGQITAENLTRYALYKEIKPSKDNVTVIIANAN